MTQDSVSVIKSHSIISKQIYSFFKLCQTNFWFINMLYNCICFINFDFHLSVYFLLALSIYNIQYKNKFPTFVEFVLWQFYTGLFSLPYPFIEPLPNLILCQFVQWPTSQPLAYEWGSDPIRNAKWGRVWRASLITTDTFYLLLLIILAFSVNSPNVDHYPSLVGSPWLWNCWFHSIHLHHFDCLSQFCTYLYPPLFSPLSLDLYKEHTQWKF